MGAHTHLLTVEKQKSPGFGRGIFALGIVPPVGLGQGGGTASGMEGTLPGSVWATEDACAQTV